MREQKIYEVIIENNLVFCIDPRKAFAIKSVPRSVSRNTSHKDKIRPFSISVKFWFRLLYKTMTKPTVYLNNFAKKSGFRLQSEAVCLLNSPLLERSDDLSNKKHNRVGSLQSTSKPKCGITNHSDILLVGVTVSYRTKQTVSFD